MKSRSPRAALARLARSTSAGSEAGGKSPGHSTPRSDRGSASRPRTNSDSGVPDSSAVVGGVLATYPMYLGANLHSDDSALRWQPPPTKGEKRHVRILVATDSIGAMSSREAGEVIAAGWRPGAEVAVLPIGEAGAGFVAAYADLAGITTSAQVIDGRTVTTGSGSSTAVVRVQGSDQGSQGAGIPYQQSSRS